MGGYDPNDAWLARRVYDCPVVGDETSIEPVGSMALMFAGRRRRRRAASRAVVRNEEDIIILPWRSIIAGKGGQVKSCREVRQTFLALSEDRNGT
jgi:hypothetical protein